MSDTMHFILEIAMFVLACGMILAFIRAVRGPRFTDRIVAINMIGTMTTVMIGILSAYLGETSLKGKGGRGKMSIREIIAAICIFIGLFVFLCSILGIYRFKYAMNRMHAAALGDTMGIFFVVLGLLILGQDIFHMAKYALIILFFWLSSPISTHLIAKVELLTNKDCEERMKDR